MSLLFDHAGRLRPRPLGAALTAAAACAATIVFLLSVDGADWRAVRESLPLALAVGAVVGWYGYARRPKTLVAGVIRGVTVAGAGLVLFLAAYATADAVIETAKTAGVAFGAAWSRAAGRVLTDLWAAGPAALLLSAIAGMAARRPAKS